MSEALTAREQSRLSKLETVIERGKTAIFETGAALREIRDAKLYRRDYATFEDYLKERWNMSRRQGYLAIDAAAVAETMSPIGDIPNEAQARELVPLLNEPEQMMAAWKEVNESDEPVTARRIKEVVDTIKPKPQTKIENAVETPCYFCKKPVVIGAPTTGRHILSGWIFPRKDGGTNSVSRAVYGDEYACKDCLRGSTGSTLTEGDLRRSDGMVLDLRNGDGVLSSVRRGEDAMRAIVLVRENGVLDEGVQAEVISTLDWIKKEAAKTAALLGRERT